MATLKHYEGGKPLVRTALTDSDGVWCKDVTYGEHQEINDLLIGDGEDDFPAADEQLLIQCRGFVRDENGDEFDNLKTLEDIHRFGLRWIKEVVKSCVEALQIKI